MKNILIPTQTNDIHAVAVFCALERLGAKPIMIHGADFPSRQFNSINIDTKCDLQCKFEDKDFNFNFNDISVVWNRRLTAPVIPDGMLNDQDLPFMKIETKTYFRHIWIALSESVFWVNPRVAQYAANSKILQLKIARDLGFEFPATLISNKSNDILSFFERHDNVIYKPFISLGEVLDGKNAVHETVDVYRSDLPSEGIQQLSIGIFQEKIEKKTEVRIVVFGRQIYAVEIFSQSNERTLVDWRNHSLGSVAMKKVEIPDPVKKFCFNMLRVLGLVYGAFDFIIKSNEQWVFLEVNESGQFLFMEQLDPTLELLDAFSRFLIDPKADDTKSHGKPISFDEVVASDRYIELHGDNLENHIPQEVII
ncbi:MvdC/MvdD family ATP grasp protein [Sphingobium yanoikuyae]|uniref:MvdD-like pre-ATP grasp domain-containing protein n=1 Tax=Sphingobium yanoikuyae TaxID=13690 RepID=A0A9X7YEJ8_SPHYA|nr:hypothetical protein [Sphingobium yanoikuyae]QNG47727.1 hypothetical protein H3V42_09195 [Sphingobium yanoikuyae]